MQLNKSLQAWGTPEFEAVCKRELAEVALTQLPLRQALTYGSYVLDDLPTVTFIAAREDAQTIHVMVGVFYHSVLGGCSCADDPTPVEAQNEYGEFAIEIDRSTGAAVASLRRD